MPELEEWGLPWEGTGEYQEVMLPGPSNIELSHSTQVSKVRRRSMPEVFLRISKVISMQLTSNLLAKP